MEESRDFFKYLKARTSGFSDDELCMCMDCYEQGIQYKEFKNGGTHHGHHFMPDNAWVKGEYVNTTTV